METWNRCAYLGIQDLVSGCEDEEDGRLRHDGSSRFDQKSLRGI